MPLIPVFDNDAKYGEIEKEARLPMGLELSHATMSLPARTGRRLSVTSSSSSSGRGGRWKLLISSSDDSAGRTLLAWDLRGRLAEDGREEREDLCGEGIWSKSTSERREAWREEDPTRWALEGRPLV